MVALEAARGGIEEDSSHGRCSAPARLRRDDTGSPDHGIWEIRGHPSKFTHSRAMVWAALDRGVRAVRDHGLDRPAETWETLRATGSEHEIDEQGYDTERGHYIQYYGSTRGGASLLLLAAGRILRHDDRAHARHRRGDRGGTARDGLVLRYRATSVDGLPGGEHPFLACSFWLVEQYAHQRPPGMRKLMDRLGGLRTTSGCSRRSTTPCTPPGRQHAAGAVAPGARAGADALASASRREESENLVAASEGAPREMTGAEDRRTRPDAAGRPEDQLQRVHRCAEVVRWMTAMQAQDFAGAKWSIGLRVPGSAESEIDAAFADGTIVRSWPMRGTLHVVAPEDLR